MGLPNFQDYHCTHRLLYFLKYLKPGLLEESWIDKEHTLCNNLDISNLPFLSSKINLVEILKKQLFSISMQAYLHLEKPWYLTKQKYDFLYFIYKK